MNWAPSLIAAITPFVVIYQLTRPQVAQSFVFRIMVFVATVLLGLGWFAGWRPFARRVTLPVILAVCYLLSILASLVNSQVPIFSLKQAMMPLCGFLFGGLIIGSPQRRRVLERLCLTIVITAFLMAIQGIGQYFGLDFIHYSGEIPKNSVIATMGHPNYLSAVLGPALFILLGYVVTDAPRRWKLLSVAGVFVLLLCIMLARTRSVWLGVLCAFSGVLVLAVIYCWRHKIGMRWLRGLAIGLLLSGALLGGIVFVVLPALDAPIDIKERFRVGIEIKSRFYYWYAAYERGLERPILGQGYAMFDPQFWDYAVAQQKSEMGPYFYDLLPAISGSTPGHVHNEYLEVFCEQGLFGLIGLLAFIGFFVYFGILAVMREPNPPLAFRHILMIGALIVSLTNAFFGFPWRLSASLICFMTIVAWIYETIYGCENGTEGPKGLKEPKGPNENLTV